MSVHLNFLFEKNYRETSSRFYVSNKEFKDDFNFSLDIKLPEKGLKRFYIINGYPDYKIFSYNDYFDDSYILDYQKIYLDKWDTTPQYFCYKNQKWTSEKLINESVKHRIIPENLKTKIINDDYDGIYFCFVIDSKRDINFKKVIAPEI